MTGHMNTAAKLLLLMCMPLFSVESAAFPLSRLLQTLHQELVRTIEYVTPNTPHSTPPPTEPSFKRFLHNTKPLESITTIQTWRTEGDAQHENQEINILPVVRHTTIQAKRFSKDFIKGAILGSSIIENHQNRAIDQWLQAPQAMRIFIIGASDDEATAAEIKITLKPYGYKVFFYKFCTDFAGNLCPEELVGAIYSTSGHTIIISSRKSALSDFVKIELSAIKSLRENRFLIIATSNEIIIGTTTATIATATLLGYENNESRQHKAQSKRSTENLIKYFRDPVTSQTKISFIQQRILNELTHLHDYYEPRKANRFARAPKWSMAPSAEHRENSDASIAALSQSPLFAGQSIATTPYKSQWPYIFSIRTRE
jgi:hypothetical protein